MKDEGVEYPMGSSRLPPGLSQEDGRKESEELIAILVSIVKNAKFRKHY